MKDLKSQSSIDAQIESDKKAKNKKSEIGSEKVGDKVIISEADKSTKDAGTSEGGKEITRAVEGAMDSVDKSHEKTEMEMNSLISQVERIEKDLIDRSKKTDDDAKTMASAAAAMKSRETTDARSKVKDAESAAKDDVRFLADASDKEKQTRTEGKREIQSQKSKLKTYKPKRR